MIILVTMLLAILSLAPVSIEGKTPQMPDIIVLDEVEYRVNTNPLEPFFQVNPTLRPISETRSSANWRGYVAEWAITDDSLVLTDIKINVSVVLSDATNNASRPEITSVLSDVFPNQDRVTAHWFTGHLVVPTGDLVEYSRLDYASRYSHYTIITIIDGLVVQVRDKTLLQFDKFRMRQFELYKLTEEYQNVLERTESRSRSRFDSESFLFDAMTGVYTSIVFDDD